MWWSGEKWSIWRKSYRQRETKINFQWCYYLSFEKYVNLKSISVIKMIFLQWIYSDAYLIYIFVWFSKKYIKRVQSWNPECCWFGRIRDLTTQRRYPSLSSAFPSSTMNTQHRRTQSFKWQPHLQAILPSLQLNRLISPLSPPNSLSPLFSLPPASTPAQIEHPTDLYSSPPFWPPNQPSLYRRSSEPRASSFSKHLQMLIARITLHQRNCARRSRSVTRWLWGAGLGLRVRCLRALGETQGCRSGWGWDW